MKQWLLASGGGKKGFVPGFSTCGDPELVGFKQIRKYPKFIKLGGSKEAVQKAASYIVQLQLQNAAQQAQIAAQNKHIKDIEERQKADMRAIYTKLDLPLPEHYREAEDVGGSGGLHGSGTGGSGGLHGSGTGGSDFRGGSGGSGGIGGSQDGSQAHDTNWFED